MQRNTPETPRNPRRSAERDATQAMGGQPRSDEEDDELQEPDRVPSFLSARELQAKDPAKGSGDSGGDRHGSASFAGTRDEPPVSDAKPARGDRGLPETQTEAMLRKGRIVRPSGGDDEE